MYQRHDIPRCQRNLEIPKTIIENSSGFESLRTAGSGKGIRLFEKVSVENAHNIEERKITTCESR